jgi:hypothetical protein
VVEIAEHSTAHSTTRNPPAIFIALLVDRFRDQSTPERRIGWRRLEMAFSTYGILRKDA